MIRIDDIKSNFGLNITGMTIVAHCPECGWHGNEPYRCNREYLGTARLQQIYDLALKELNKKHKKSTKARSAQCSRKFEKK